MLIGTSFEVSDASIHNLKKIDCGKQSLNEYLSRFAVKNNILGLSRTWISPCQPNDKKAEIAAYFTLASISVTRESLPKQSKSVPSYPIPIVLLARLAVSINHQNKQPGIKTLVHALRTAYSIHLKGPPTIGVVIDVLDDDAMNFYNKVALLHKPTVKRLFKIIILK
ncbi:GNAT family N-acetyltransferase [Acinetobacter sp. Marseille-Q1618]|uniref:GNAT family N-acetyltransferase n=1 Tax=Acinetobacter sp. Marseille-Q1618 TaxID=2697502 RepID=UPI00156EB2B8|nr:GNAT family N-acetyltransferase [Acinetobacter sp. Marseille-Q1618]